MYIVREGFALALRLARLTSSWAGLRSVGAAQERKPAHFGTTIAKTKLRQ